MLAKLSLRKSIHSSKKSKCAVNDVTIGNGQHSTEDIRAQFPLPMHAYLHKYYVFLIKHLDFFVGVRIAFLGAILHTQNKPSDLTIELWCSYTIR